jgi:ATP-dependent RNA helicase DDX3X
VVVIYNKLQSTGQADPHGSTAVLRTSIDDRGALPLAVILAPTRELASQIHGESRKVCYSSGIKSSVVYGGADIRSQLVDLSTGTDLIVATPGRMSDLIERGIVSLSVVEHLILDEADRMLDMGFEVTSAFLSVVDVDVDVDVDFTSIDPPECPPFNPIYFHCYLLCR